MRFLKIGLMALLAFTPAVTFASSAGEGAGRAVASSHKASHKTKAKKKKKAAKSKKAKKAKGKKAAKKSKKAKKARKAKRAKKAARVKRARKHISHQPAEEMVPDPSQNFEITPAGIEGQDELPPPNMGDLSE